MAALSTYFINFESCIENNNKPKHRNMITLSNSTLTISIKRHGAELCSIIKNGNEHLWQADPSIWADAAVRRADCRGDSRVGV